jgi:hypothetical protein
MRHFPAGGGAAVAIFVLAGASSASAQIYETVGTRAQGMGGAFVAVADDATATWWNPAGLGSGTLLSAIVQRGTWDQPGAVPDPGPAQRDQATSIAFLYPALGLSYYRLRISEIAPITSTAATDPGRQDPGAPGVRQRSLAMSQYGVTVGQSLAPGVVIASTARLIRGGVSLASSGAVGTDALDQADDFDVEVDTKADLDIGALISMGRVRVGFTMKHVGEPEFGEGELGFVLERQARIGVAFITGSAGPIDAVVAAVDADLTETPTVLGEAKYVAAGGEAWFFGRKLGLRGGISMNTVGETQSTGSVGGSLTLGRGMFIDGALSVGSDPLREGWSTGFRVTF